jgi:hypothetical protein
MRIDALRRPQQVQYQIKVEWQDEDGRKQSAELGTLEAAECQSAADVGLKLSSGKEFLTRLQEIVVRRQLDDYCEASRSCPNCKAPRNIKDYRTRQIDTVFGRILIETPRYEQCRFCETKRGCVSPLSELLRGCALPELEHLQAKLAADLPYRKAAALLREILPVSERLTAATIRNRTLAVGKRIEAELSEEIDKPAINPHRAEHLTVGIDGAFVKLKRDKDGGRRNFEILTGRIERTRGRGRAFAIVRDLDKRAKQKVQAVLRLAGRTSETSITVLTDGEERLRGIVGWFGRKCEHRLDWFHISRRLDRIGKQLVYLPSSPIYGSRLGFHSKNLYRIRWELWNSGIAIADDALKIFRAGLAEDAWDSPKHLRLFQSVETQLDELRSYLYANESSVGKYAKIFRSGERVSTAHVESTVNQLINWRFCKKQQMTWTRAGAQGLLHVKTAALNGTLATYTKCLAAAA